jgi:uncharacterized protein (DUF2236 family)
MPTMAFSPAHTLRDILRARVRSVFNDQSRGEQPVASSDNALFAPGSVIRRVHGDVTTMMVGGMSALLLQMLHPAALAGVLDHSNFEQDMLGRLRRTARFIAITTFGERVDAEAAIARVRSIHDQVRGTLADGTDYHASDPRLLAWVHVVEAKCFLDAWIAYAEPMMSRADQDRYFADFALIARMLGAGPVPQTRNEAEALIQSYRPELRASPDCKRVARLVLSARLPGATTFLAQSLLSRAATDLLPRWARKMLDLNAVGLGATLIRPATFGMAATLRWAFFARESRK